MKKIWNLLLLIPFCVCPQSEKDVYLFSYFKNNGEDGLHLAYSYNALQWEALRQNQSFLKPTAGKDQLMRDP
jgi:hypothetical protein